MFPSGAARPGQGSGPSPGGWRRTRCCAWSWPCSPWAACSPSPSSTWWVLVPGGRGPGEDPMPASRWWEPGLSPGTSQFWTPRVWLPKSHPWRNPPHSPVAGPPGGSVAVGAPPPIFLFGAPESSRGQPHRRCPEAWCRRHPVLSSRPPEEARLTLGETGGRPGLKLGGHGGPASWARLRVHVHVPTVLQAPHLVRSSLLHAPVPTPRP